MRDPFAGLLAPESLQALRSTAEKYSLVQEYWIRDSRERFQTWHLRCEANLVQPYWRQDSYERGSFCQQCAEQKLAEERKLAELQAAMRTAAPSLTLCLYTPPKALSMANRLVYCSTCQAPLDVLLSPQGCEEEIGWLEERGFDPNSPEDCYVLVGAIEQIGMGHDGVPGRISVLAYHAKHFDLEASQRFFQTCFGEEISEAVRITALTKGSAVTIAERFSMTMAFLQERRTICS